MKKNKKCKKKKLNEHVPKVQEYPDNNNQKARNNFKKKINCHSSKPFQILKMKFCNFIAFFVKFFLILVL